jgi:hypothetical protein
VFDPQTIQDHATFEKPMQYATGVSEVWVNGVAVIRDGEHTGAKPWASGVGGNGRGSANDLGAGCGVNPWVSPRAVPLDLGSPLGTDASSRRCEMTQGHFQSLLARSIPSSSYTAARAAPDRSQV